MNALTRRTRSVYAQVLRRRRHRVVILTEPVAASTDPAIFLIGCTRSGTSLLRRIVDSHSAVACPPESHFLIPMLATLSDHRSMVGLESMGFSRTAVVERVRQFAERFFQDYAAAAGKRRWADKTPFYADHLDSLDELFGGCARYVMIYRHGLDVTRSIADSLPEWVATLEAPGGRREHGEVRAAAAYWAACTGRMLAFERLHPERTLHVRYERLTADPEAEVRRIFEFLGEPFEPGVLDFNRNPHDEGLEDGKVKSTRGFEPVIGSYKRWDGGTLQAAVAEAAPSLAALGYEV